MARYERARYVYAAMIRYDADIRDDDDVVTREQMMFILLMRDASHYVTANVAMTPPIRLSARYLLPAPICCCWRVCCRLFIFVITRAISMSFAERLWLMRYALRC